MLGRIALRIASVEALKGNTLVGDNVLDSQIGALDVASDSSIRTDQEKPFISIYVEGGRVTDGLDLRALHRTGQTDFTIETGITTSMVVTDPDTGVSEVIPGLPATDRAFEFYLDAVGRQIVNAMSDPDNEWAEIWRGLCSGVSKIERKRTSDAASGTRIAAHQLVMTLDLLPDPVFGQPLAPTSIWARFFAKLQAVEHEMLPILLMLIGDQSSTAEFCEERRRYGLTFDEVRALLVPQP